MAFIVDPLAVPNQPEEISLCSPVYGTRLNYEECSALASELPRSTIPIPYNTQGQGEFGLPYQQNSGQSQRGTCHGVSTSVDREISHTR